MEMAARAVEMDPGHTAYWYDSQVLPGRATMDRTYSSFARAVKHDLIVPRPGPRVGTTVYHPATATA